MKKIPFFIFTLTLISVLFSGCVQNSGEVEFILPSADFLHQCQPDLTLQAWEITATKGSTQQKTFLSPEAKSFLISPALTGDCLPLSVKATPIIKTGTYTGQFFYPAGTVFPQDNQLTWLNGFTAHLLQLFYLSAISDGTDEQTVLSSAVRFNWGRFMKVLSEKNQTEKISDPWLLDIDSLLEGIFTGNLTDSFISLNNCRQVQLTILFSEPELSDFPLLLKFLPEAEKIFTGQKDFFIIQKNKPAFFIYQFNSIVSLSITQEKSLFLELNSLPIYNYFDEKKNISSIENNSAGTYVRNFP